MLQQTHAVPIVFVIVADPVGSGFVESLALPGGNATGFTVMAPTIGGKWLELLKGTAPALNCVAGDRTDSCSPGSSCRPSCRDSRGSAC